MKKFLLFIFMLYGFTSMAQELEVTGKTINPSNSINDGAIEVEVEGGVSPYT